MDTIELLERATWCRATLDTDEARELVYREFVEPDIQYHFYSNREYAEKICSAVCMTLGFVVLYQTITIEGLTRYRIL